MRLDVYILAMGIVVAIVITSALIVVIPESLDMVSYCSGVALIALFVIHDGGRVLWIMT